MGRDDKTENKCCLALVRKMRENGSITMLKEQVIVAKNVIVSHFICHTYHRSSKKKYGIDCTLNIQSIVQEVLTTHWLVLFLA